MTNFPNSIDSDLELPPVYDNIVEAGSEAIQAIRSALFAVEENIGINGHGNKNSISERLSVSIDEDGLIRPSMLTGLGLVTLPITNSQISATAAIDESKLNLIFSTQLLYNLIQNLDSAVTVLNNFVSITGIKIEPHIAGSAFKHSLSHINVDSGTLNRVNINSGATIPRSVTNAYTLISEISNDLLSHTRSDGSSNTTTPPANQAHNASGIYINPANFVSVPQTASDLQSFADFVDGSSLVLLGSRTQNLYSNGIPRSTHNISLTNDQAAEAIVDPTPATTYLLFGSATSPVDDIDHGDDVILLNPSNDVLSNNTFDAQFSKVKSGDYITVNYGNGSVAVKFTIDSTKKFLNGSTRVYAVRINGKNLYASSDAIVKIDRPFYHDAKFNTLALAAAHNSFSDLPSLIISNPSGAAALGIGFDPSKLDTNHYRLYLEFYPTGNPAQKSIVLPAIDVTGDSGNSSGSYTLQSVVESINDKFREPGFNFRFIAFAYQGQLGIALADRYNNASFSIIAGTTDGYGNYTSTSNASFPGNVVDNYNVIDPLGFGVTQANIASPPFAISYSTPLTALQTPTVLFSPLKKNFYYVDGVERDGFALEKFTTKDGYGDGYWPAILTTKQILSNRVEVTYEIDFDLSTSGLSVGKTLVVQPAVAINSTSYSAVDYGRFTISNIAFNNCPGPSSTTTITVYDAIHGTGLSPYLSSVNIPVYIYFCDDSVSFNTEHVSDPSTHIRFKRFFEVYIDANGNSFTHERARFNIIDSNVTIDNINGFVLYGTPEMANINLVDISPKLRGFSFGQYRKINLFFNNYDASTGIFDGYLSKFESPSTYTKIGPTITGKQGEVVRFYDDTNIDYIDISIPINLSISSFSNKSIDIQLFPSLQLNQEKILIGTCQLQDSNKRISYLQDRRQFGNVSEKQLSTSALNYISAPQRLLDENGIIRGFDLVYQSDADLNKINIGNIGLDAVSNDDRTFSIMGGTALIDGKFVSFNDTIISLPILQEALYPSFSTVLDTVRWYLCINSNGEFEFIASTDFLPSDAGTYGSLDHNRLFYAKNPNTSAVYPVRGTYFSKLLSEFKDVIPLYVIEVTVDPPSSIDSAKFSDVRRFTEKGYRGLTTPFTLGQLASFRTVLSVLSFLKELLNYNSFSVDKRNIFGNTVKVKDTFELSGLSFNLASIIKFEGDGGRFTVTGDELQVSVNNVEFRNLDIAVSDVIGFELIGDYNENVVFDKCNIEYSYNASGNGSYNTNNLSNIDKGCIYLSTTSSFKNIQITNCNFTSNIEDRFPFVSLLLNGSTHYLENVIIDNNKVTTTAVTDDKRAAFVISVTSATTPVGNLGPRLVNCSISGNICNKNQLILMSGPTNGSNKIPNMIVPVNVLIERNICGAICYLTRQDRVAFTPNTTSINDKNNMIIISKNMCRLIYCGTNLGFINVVGSSDRVIEDIIVGSDIYSSSAIITDNTCSWIQVGTKQASSSGLYEIPMLRIASNKINAYNPTFLDDYYSIISAENTAIIADVVVGT